MHTYGPNQYSNLLTAITFELNEIRVVVSSYKLTFFSKRNNEVEWRIKLPMFVDAFHTYVIENQRILAQQESFDYYLKYSTDFFQNLNRPDLEYGIYNTLINMAKNIGEYDEMRAKLHLIKLRDARKSVVINGQRVVVRTVKNDGVECNSLPTNTNLTLLSDTQVENLAKQVGAFKAPAGSKADVYVNGYGISVKSHRGANPAFLNHTHRAGFMKVCNRINTSIDQLDNIINDYWEKRKLGVIGEDVKNSDPNSPFKDHLDYLKPIMNYFLFKGTAQKDSLYPADYILDFIDPVNETSWKFSKDEYIEDNWNHIIFSIRSKGMPESYPKCKNAASIRPWVQIVEDKYKGSLHGRAQY